MIRNLIRKIPLIFPIVLTAIGLVSCASKDDASEDAAVSAIGMNGGYGSASTVAPVPQNPHQRLSSDISSSQSVTITNGSRSQKFIALTFDDGPHPSHTPRLLDMLRRRNVKATFYVIGELVERYPQIVKRMVLEGHEIGNHTWTHSNLKKLSDNKVRWEFNITRDAIVAATGVQPRTMRPPYGSLSTRQREWIFKEYGYPTVMWDVDPLDWKRPGSSVVASRLINGARNGSILLVHDLHGGSVDAMPHTIDTLLKQGYQFVTVSQMIAQGTVATR